MSKNNNQKIKNTVDAIFFVWMFVATTIMSLVVISVLGAKGGSFYLWVAISTSFNGWVALGIKKLGKGDVTELLEQASTIKLSAILLVLAIIWPISVNAADKYKR